MVKERIKIKIIMIKITKSNTNKNMIRINFHQIISKSHQKMRTIGLILNTKIYNNNNYQRIKKIKLIIPLNIIATGIINFSKIRTSFKIRVTYH